MTDNIYTVKATLSVLKDSFLSSVPVPFDKLKITQVRFDYHYIAAGTDEAGPVKTAYANLELSDSPLLSAQVDVLPNKTYMVRVFTKNERTPNGVYSGYISFTTTADSDQMYQMFYVVESDPLFAEPPGTPLSDNYKPVEGAVLTVVSDDEDMNGLQATSMNNGLVYFSGLKRGAKINIVVGKAGYVEKTIEVFSIGSRQGDYIVLTAVS